MRYEYEVMAALVQFAQPNTRLISRATGISERKVQGVLRTLCDDMKMDIKRVRENRQSYFKIVSWGVFESGVLIRQQLERLDLVKVKAARLAARQGRSLTTLADKQRYFDAVKLQNYQESQRLEGITGEDMPLPDDFAQLQQCEKELIDYYTRRSKRRIANAG